MSSPSNVSKGFLITRNSDLLFKVIFTSITGELYIDIIIEALASYLSYAKSVLDLPRPLGRGLKKPQSSGL